MGSKSTFCKLALVAAILSTATAGYSQIYDFTTDSVGHYSTVATHANGNNLGRINGATPPSPACEYGFSSKAFTTATTFATILPADTMTVWASSGYLLAISGFSVDIRRSTTGPQNVRYAYRIDSNTTWVNQGSDQAPNNASCDSMITATWTTPIIVEYPHKLEFAVFGFNATSTSGTFQIENLKVNGVVAATTEAGQVTGATDVLTVYPNPADGAISIAYRLATEEQVSLSVYNMAGQQTTVFSNSTESAGEHIATLDVKTPGIYFVRLTTGNQTTSRTFVKR